MKKLTVKISKQTGYHYLEANKVKAVIDELMDHYTAQGVWNRGIDKRLNDIVGDIHLLKDMKPMQQKVNVGKSSLSLCPNCMCMTKTIKGNCGKCGGQKRLKKYSA